MSGLLIVGTASGAGKSTVTAGLCRAFARRGISVAPFKAQNMSNNSVVVPGADGSAAEIARAQWVQATAARVPAEPAMNPVLLKPTGDRASEVVLLGKPAGRISSSEWATGRRHLAATAFEAFDTLTARFDVVLAEGAGSPAEINLRAGDYVNMGLARHGAIPTVIVGDIDRGGVFAALYGTLALMAPADQALVAGFVINKFRGEPQLLEPATSALAAATGRPVFGIVPAVESILLDAEDTLDLERTAADADAAKGAAAGAGAGAAAGAAAVSGRGPAVDVAVVRLPRFGDISDIDSFRVEPQIRLRYVSRPEDVADAALVIVPDTADPAGTAAFLRGRGLDVAIADHAARGRPVLGIGGGFAALGHGVVAADGCAQTGLGLLPVDTALTDVDIVGAASAVAGDRTVSGYQSHRLRMTPRATSGETVRDFPGGIRRGSTFGTLWHGLFDDDAFRSDFLSDTIGLARSGTSVAAARQRQADQLADLIEANLDVDALVALATSGAPTGLPMLPPAGF